MNSPSSPAATDRRKFLRGTGVAMALPLLPAVIVPVATLLTVPPEFKWTASPNPPVIAPAL